MELIKITDGMSAAEKKEAREHNRRIAYAELENENKAEIMMTEEEQQRAKEMLTNLLKKRFPELNL